MPLLEKRLEVVPRGVLKRGGAPARQASSARAWRLRRG
jgi:hypothetical protein